MEKMVKRGGVVELPKMRGGQFECLIRKGGRVCLVEGK